MVFWIFVFLDFWFFDFAMYKPKIRRPSGVLDESEVKPPFFPPFTPPKKRAPESPQGGGGPRNLFFMEDAEPARSGVDAAGGEFRRL